jgi:hypothetical protein
MLQYVIIIVFSYACSTASVLLGLLYECNQYNNPNRNNKSIGILINPNA